MKFVVIIAAVFLFWLLKMYRDARRFTRFRRLISTDIRPRVILYLTESTADDNNSLRRKIEAVNESQFVTWQVACEYDLIGDIALSTKQQHRFAQHLKFIEQQANQ